MPHPKVDSRPMRTMLITLALLVTMVAPWSSLSAPETGDPIGGIRLADQPVSADLSAFTLNVAYPLSRRKVRQDIRRIMTEPGAQVGGLQEFSQPRDRRVLIQQATKRNWGWFIPDDGARTIPIIWDRSRFRLIAGETEMVHGAGGKGFPSRWISSVRLREISTGKVFGIINTHTIARASFDAQPHDRHGDSSRIGRLRLHLARLREAMLALHEQTEFVIALGDLNVNYLADRRRQVAGLPTDALGDVVSFNMPLEGSHGARSLLDYNLTLRPELGSGLEAASARIVHGFNSDHDAVLVAYRPIDLFATGPVLSQSSAGWHGARFVHERAARIVRNTVTGATVRVALPTLEDTTLTDALLAAVERGANVQVLLGRDPLSREEQRLAAALPVDDGTSDSWLAVCADNCTPDGGRHRMSFVSADRTGAADGVVFHLPSGPLPAEALRDTGYLISDGAVHADYVAAFERLRRGESQENARAGRFRMLFTATNARGRDLHEKFMRGVRCRGARSSQTPDGRTDIHVVMNEWRGKRGRWLVDRLATLTVEGCDVDVVAGPDVSSRLERRLRNADVPLRSAATYENIVLIDGRHRRKRDYQAVLALSAGWVNATVEDAQAALLVRGPEGMSALRARVEALGQG